MSEPFIAEIRIFAGNFAPRGWSFCDGQLLPIAQNTALFSLIGTIYGADGRMTTGLPNLQGRAPMHPGRGPGLTPRRLGEKIGSTTMTLSEAQLPSHNHAAVGNSNSASAPLPTDNLLANAPGRATGQKFVANTTAGLGDVDEIGTTGGGQSHANMQPYLTLNFIIALVGIYPSRS